MKSTILLILLFTSSTTSRHSDFGRLDKSAPKIEDRSGMVVSQGIPGVDSSYTPIYIDLSPEREKGVRAGITQTRVDVEESRLYGGYARITQEHWTFGRYSAV